MVVMIAARGGGNARQWPTGVKKHQLEVVVVAATRGGSGDSQRLTRQ